MILFGHAGFIILRGCGRGEPRQGVAIIPGHPFRRVSLQILVLPSVLACALGTALVDDLPLRESVPAVLVLAALVVAVWWQWWQTEGLRERISKLEEKVDDFYEILDGRISGTAT
jgi:hypothetical protein